MDAESIRALDQKGNEHTIIIIIILIIMGILIRNHFGSNPYRQQTTGRLPWANGFHVVSPPCGRDVKLFINIPNHGGHSAYDVAWNNKKMRDVIIHWGGISVKPKPTAHGKGGEGKGKGVKDGIGPDHHWNISVFPPHPFTETDLDVDTVFFPRLMSA